MEDTEVKPKVISCFKSIATRYTVGMMEPNPIAENMLHNHMHVVVRLTLDS